MTLLDKYNKNLNTFNFSSKDGVEYKKLSELFESGKKEIKILSFFINTKGKYGDSAVACSEDFNINLPNHLLDTVKEMIQDEHIVKLANSGGLGIEIYQYESKKWGKNYSVNFIYLDRLTW